MVIQKNIKTIISLPLILLVLLSSPLFGKEKAANAKKKTGSIVVYKFALKGDTGKIEYYSEILPKTLFQYLNKTGKYNPVLKMNTSPGISLKNPGGEGDIKIFQELAEADKNVHFICTGVIEATPEGTKATIIIYNVKKDKIRVLPASRLESGAVLGSSMDTLSDSVMTKVDYAVAEARKEASTSPYLSFYNFMSYFSFGLSSGYTFITGNPGDVYDDDIEVRTYMDISLRALVPNLSIRCSGSFFGTSNLVEIIPIEVGIKIWSAGGSVLYSLPIIKHFSISAEAGSGVAMATFINYDIADSNSGPMQSSTENHQNDAYIFTALTFDFHLKPVTISAGTGYRRIFFSAEAMNMFSVFGSIQYHL